MSTSNHILSKSSFVRGVNCHKSLYLNKFHKELRDEISASQQAIFSQGTDVGILAQGLFPNGIDCSPENFYLTHESVLKTKEAINNGETIIYEAAFEFDGVLALLDILVKDKNGWKAYEVKSSTSISDTYILDATLQSYVIKNSGIDLRDVSIVYINNAFVKNGAINLKDLFTIESVKERVDELLPTIPRQVRVLKDVLAQKQIPNVEIGAHCGNPYECDFKSHCWQHIPKYSVFNLAYARGVNWELYQQGILELKDVPDDYPLNERHQFQISAEKSGEKYIDKLAIKEFLSELKYPLAHIDFETFQSALPRFEGTRPYQQICFQWSAHIQESLNGKIHHKEFLGIEGEDPRVHFIESLIEAMKGVKTILVYNIGFERGRLNEFSGQFPDLASKIQSIIDKMNDLMLVFQQKSVYCPEMRGSYSVKKVLPALVPELSYKTLNIQEGGTASSTYANLHLEKDAEKVKQIRTDLLAYCEMDTFAMVKILEKLYELKD